MLIKGDELSFPHYVLTVIVNDFCCSLRIISYHCIRDKKVSATRMMRARESVEPLDCDVFF